MFGYQIRKLLLTDPATSASFRGIYASDTVATVSNVIDPGAKNVIVCNTSSSQHKTGIHWVLIYKSPVGNVFIDSLARPAEEYPEEIVQYLRDDVYERLPFQLQNDHYSRLCSVFVLYFADALCRDVPLAKIVQRFSIDTNYNERLVVAFYETMFSKVLPICSLDVTSPTERLGCLSLGDIFMRMNKNKL